MQIRPGKRRPRFIDRCAKMIDRCVVEELADYPIIVAGESIAAIMDVEVEKVGFGDGPDSVAQTISLSWLAKDQPNARHGDRVIIGERHYTIKRGYPIDRADCWLYAELNDCGEC